jgi:hypothetical protein
MTLQTIEPPERVYRLGRRPDPWQWPDWTHAGVDGTFGNRFDDPDSEYRVLYASSQREATFRECLARFRPDPAVQAAVIVDNDDDPLSPTTIAAGQVPRRWLDDRCMGTGRLEGTYCDVGHADSLAHLRHALAPRLLHFRLDDLDAGDIRSRSPRAFTQELGRYINAQTSDGRPTFAGIRYASRHGDELTNWAIFEPNEPIDRDAKDLTLDDPDLRVVAASYGLKLTSDA